MNCKSCGDKIERETEGEELCPVCWSYGEQYAYEQEMLEHIYRSADEENEEKDEW